MYKLLLLLAFICVNANANKHWIALDQVNNNSNFVMHKPSSYNKKRISRSNKSAKGQKIRLIDKPLLKSIRNVQNMAKKNPYK